MAGENQQWDDLDGWMIRMGRVDWVGWSYGWKARRD